MDPFPAYPHEVLAVVLSVHADTLYVLLWRRAQDPDSGRWALPGGGVRSDQRLREALSAHLATKVDVRDISWLEQVATHSRVDRDPRARVLATGYLALVPTDVEPRLPDDTAWHAVDALPRLAFDHVDFIDAAIERLRAKLSYTNVGFALVPTEFTIQQLRRVVSATLGYDVGATNLQRVMSRRSMIEPTGARSAHGPDGGRPAALYRFCDRTLHVTDPFAVFRPPRSP
ncbi:MAG TPA: NUDIX domain-containing protein [Nocardioides sp.]|uniref:NUDIX hydrolase n=1 Tax=Nocardioides sp. TaxID=35761 RepID=UPI002E37788C|nr:NUDIX domain-containing protein [Nocardioides sp.]HEX3931084.1 NUDIX domain-containing protein [Nocardioides sp.]